VAPRSAARSVFDPTVARHLGGKRAADWKAERSIRMQAIGDEDVVSTIADHILATCCASYAVSMCVADCGVLRPHEF